MNTQTQKTPRQSSKTPRAAPDASTSLQCALLDIVYERAFLSIGASVVCGLVIAPVLAGHVDPDALIVWLLVLMVVSAIRFVGVVLYRRRHQAVSEGTWRGLFIAGAIAAGCVWGGLGLALLPATSVVPAISLTYQVLVAFVVGGMVAAAVTTLAPVRPAFFGFAALVLLPAIARFLAMGSDVHLAIAALLAMFGMVMCALALHTAELTRRSVRFGFHNTELVEGLRDAQRTEQRLNAHKDLYLATMSHEIRSPLNGILGVLTLLEESDLSSDQKRLATLASEAGKGLLHTLNEILDCSRIESGNVALERVRFNVRDVVEHVVDMAASDAQCKDLELVCDIDPRLPASFVGDPHRLRQILTNLISNAVKFTERGEVSVKVDVESRDDDEAVLMFSVRDTGIGLSKDEQAEIFAPYAQASVSTTRRNGGTGLGLAIARQLVRMMCGRLEVDSAPGAGSIFRFTLVLQRPLDDDDIPAESSGAACPLRVLVVDEGGEGARALRRQLEFLGARVKTSAGGDSAIAALRRAAVNGDRFDAVISQAPRFDPRGERFSSRVRSDSSLGDVAVLVQVTMAQYGREKRGGDTAAAVRLPRPTRFCALRDALDGLMSAHARGCAVVAFPGCSGRVA